LAHVDPEHTNGAHDVAAAAEQVPLPLHRRAGVAEALLQVAGAQTALVPCRRQSPAPSQVPSVPQEASLLVAHWLRGSAPARTGLQLPLARPVSLAAQDMHLPVQGESQQIPAEQLPDLQSVPVAHWPPSARLHSAELSATH
jgi:hypothetical protein